MWGGRLIIDELELSDIKNVERYCEYLSNKFSRIHILINNTGGPPGGPGMGPGGPANMVPIDGLDRYLGRNRPQQAILGRWLKVVAALRSARFAMPAFAELKLTDDQIEKLSAGKKLQDILTATQKRVLENNQMRGFGPGGPSGGPGFGPGGPPPNQ